MVGDLVRALPQLALHFGADVRYSINVLPAQAVNIQFMQHLVRQLQQTRRAAAFMLELTEESLAAAGPFQSLVLPLLRDSGIGISIDDFGTGYSSLAKLAELTVDEIKIDRSLIRSIHDRPRNQRILRAIESMGTALDISVVAEGIETIEESCYLIAQTGMRLGQGYLFHRPQLLADLLPDTQSSSPAGSYRP